MRPFNFSNRSLIIRTNYGDDSIALTQWVFEAGLSATVVYIDTGFAASLWNTRIALGEAHAKTCEFSPLRIVSKISFVDAVSGRGSFPSAKFQWCAGLLKGLPFLDWLETVDLEGEAIVLIAKRRSAAKAHAHLPEWIERCEYHGERTVWHPLLDIDDSARDGLLDRAGFIPLRHRSLECEPCVNSSEEDLERLAVTDKKRLLALEKAVSVTWVHSPTPVTEKYLDLFYRGCGNHFGCGL
jgi:hypothetical protein